MSIRALILAAILLRSGLIIYCQTVTVIDNTTQQTIPGVVIYSNTPSVSVVTNSKGESDLSSFISADSIFFRQIGYKTITYSYVEIEALNFKIELEESTISLEEVVVSATRWEENQAETPNRIEKLYRKEASFQNPQTAADLLGISRYVFIQKSQLGGGSPMLRGFATNSVMLVVDGVRMNNAIYRSGNLQNVISLDAASIESVEILFGPGAVMYGSDAIGGVMDFHTLNPKMSDSSAKILFTGNAFGRYSSANTEKSGHIDLNIGLKKVAFVTSFSYADYEDLHTGSKGNPYYLRPNYVATIDNSDTLFTNADPTLQISSGYSQINILQKIRYILSTHWEVDYGFHYSTTSDVPRYDRLTLDANGNGVPDNAVWYYGPQKWIMNRLGLTNHRTNKVYDQLRLVAALQHYEESRHDRKFNNKYQRNQWENVFALSLNLDLNKNISEKATLLYGAEMLYNSIGSTANRTQIETLEEEPTNTRYPDGSTWQAYGAYANTKYKFNSKWILNAGIRYSHFIAKADFDTTFLPLPFTHTKNSNGAINGSIGFVYTPFKIWLLYLNGSTGFRAPNIDDIGKVFESEPGSVVVPNDNLKPEYAYNIETGTAFTAGNFLKFDLSLYYTLLDNALARRNFQFNGEDSILYDGKMSQVQAIQNINKAYVWGIQAGVVVNFGKGVAFQSTMSYQKGKEQSSDSTTYYPKSHVAPLFGSTHLTYQEKHIKLDLYAEYNARVDHEDLALAEQNDNAVYAKDQNGLAYVPFWYTLNFKAAWYINKYAMLSFGIENFTDQLYRPYASGISAPGRNFIVALNCKI